jgi:CPA1 family monovalent cation:H+ antiporter
MDIFKTLSLIFTFSVAIGYINHRFFKMQTTIAIMMGALSLSLLLILGEIFHFTDFGYYLHHMLELLHFDDLLLKGMLSFLLFAGAQSLDISILKGRKWEIGTLAVFGTIASFFIIATGIYYLLPLINLHLDYFYCLVFGALISPTDPIAVVSTFKNLKAPKSTTMLVEGESLFNDGVGIVLFLSASQLAIKGVGVTIPHVVWLFMQEAVGGVLYGIFLGFLNYWLIKPLKEPKIAIMVTLAIVTGGYSLAGILNISGPLAMVVAGLFLNFFGQKVSFSKGIHENLNRFWEIVDEILNAVLFLLIGLELLIIKISYPFFIALLLAILLVLSTRFFTVAVPMSLFKLKKKFAPFIITILSWGGLRGGLAIALALSLPLGENRNLILAMTYGVVAFAVIVQGLTIKPIVKLSKLKYKNNQG